MADIRKIEDLRVWQSARVICKDVYMLTRKEEFAKDFRFVQQIRSAAGSIMDNIAEGFGRGGNKEFLQFLRLLRRVPVLQAQQLHLKPRILAHGLPYQTDENILCLFQWT